MQISDYVVHQLGYSNSACGAFFECARTKKHSFKEDDLKSFFDEVAKNYTHRNATYLLQRTFKSLTLERTLTVYKVTSAQFQSQLQNMSKCYDFFNNAFTQPKQNVLLRSIEACFETILSAFTFVEAGREPESSWEASHVLQVYWKIAAVPFCLVISFKALLGSTIVALTATAMAVVAIASALFIYMKFFRKLSHMLGFVNLSRLADNGTLQPIFGRDDEIQTAIAYLDCGLNTIVTGKPGTGKTAFHSGVATQMRSNEFAPHMRQREMLSGNSANLQGDAFAVDNTDRLSRFQSRILQNSQRVLVGFDEIQTLMQPRTRIAEKFKTAVDRSTQSLGPCLGTMTKEDYDNLVCRDAALARRFPVEIELKPLSCDKTVMILQALHLLDGADVLVDEDIFSLIYEKTSELKEYSQPDISIIVFCLSLAEARKKQWETKVQKELEEQRVKCQQLRSKYLKCLGKEEEDKVGKELEEISSRFSETQKLRNYEVENFKNRTTLMRSKAKTILELCQLSRSILEQPKHAQNLIWKKQFLFLKLSLLPVLEQKINAFAPIPKVDRELVTKVLTRFNPKPKSPTLEVKGEI